jgi:hypothetical protein
MTNIKHNLVGQKFGTLLVVEPPITITSGKQKKAGSKCLCDCGNTKIIFNCHLKNGHTQSCGCVAKEKASNRIYKVHLKNTKHTPWKTSALQIWRGLYSKLSFENFYNLSQKNCFYCNNSPSNKAIAGSLKKKEKIIILKILYLYITD